MLPGDPMMDGIDHRFGAVPRDDIADPAPRLIEFSRGLDMGPDVPGVVLNVPAQAFSIDQLVIQLDLPGPTSDGSPF